MRKALPFVAVLAAALFAWGCSGTGKKAAEVDVSVELLKGKTANMNHEIDALTGKVDDLAEQVVELGERAERISEVRKEASRIRSELAALDTGLGEMASRLDKMELRGGAADIKVKVLSGNNDLPSAKKAAGVLKGKGYDIRRVDLAPTANFTANTVFYGKGLKADAEKIAALFGKGTRVKPLTWRTVFDIIFVTGGQ